MIRCSARPTKSTTPACSRGKKPLSQQQKTFNRLTAKISELQQSLESDRAMMELLLAEYHTDVPGLKRALAEAQLRVANILGASAATIRYGSRQRE